MWNMWGMRPKRTASISDHSTKHQTSSTTQSTPKTMLRKEYAHASLNGVHERNKRVNRDSSETGRRVIWQQKRKMF